MRRLLWLAVAVVLIALIAWYCRPRPATPSITLEMESYGGFAYVHSPNEQKLEIAYLKDSGSECSEPVDQLGTDLMVVSGQIIEPASWTGRLFEVTGRVVTFPELEALSNNLVAERNARPNGAPGNPHDEAEWRDLKWVAGISSGSQQSDYPSHSLDPNWRGKVDGRVVLTRGHIVAGHPSDYVMQHTVFEFRLPDPKPGDSPGSGTTPLPAKFSQSITDTTRFTAEVPGDRVTIVLSPARPNQPDRIVLQPSVPGRSVKLKLIGRHVHNMAAAMPVGTPINHFCAFYALMQAIPDPSEQLIPHVARVQAVAGDRVGQPSPGSSCPGDWP